MSGSAASPAWTREELWDRRWQGLTREDLDAIHWRRIKELIHFAYHRLSFYRSLYDEAGVSPDNLNSWDDFYKRVPTLDKSDIIRDQEEGGKEFGLEATSRNQRSWFFRTSGTTGTPLKEVFTTYDRQVAGSVAWPYGWWDAGLRPGDSIYIAFNFGLFAGFWSALFSAERMGLMVIPGGGADTGLRLRQILDLKPDAVLATPTYLLSMGDRAREEGIDLSEAGVRVLSTAGEVGPNVPSFRRALRRAWGGPRIVDTYGISENLFLACECRRADEGEVSGIHVIERYAHSYSADLDTYERLDDPEAVGEHVVTTFRAGQPLIKYRTHDLVRHQGTVDHGCGWSFGFLNGGVLGRSDDMITIKGTNVYTSAVQRIVGSVDGLSPHYELHVSRKGGMDAISIRVEAADDVPADRYDDVAEKLREDLHYRVGVTMSVEVLEPEALPRYELKSKRVIDHRREE